MASPEVGGPEKPGRRDFLKKTSALAGTAVVAGIGAAAFHALDKAKRGLEQEDKRGPEQMKPKESPEMLKDRNTTIGIERAILNAPDDKDIGQIGVGIIPDKVYGFSRKFNESIFTSALAAAAVGVAGGVHLSKEIPKDVKKGIDVLAFIAVFFAAKDIYNQPSRKNVKDAEDEVVSWIQKFNTEKQLTEKELLGNQLTSNISVIKAVQKRIGELTNEQNENVRKLSGNTV